VCTLIFQSFPYLLFLPVWDLGGQTNIRPYWRCYYQNTHGIIYVVDSADEDRIAITKKELTAMLQEEELNGVKLLVFANKQGEVHLIPLFLFFF